MTQDTHTDSAVALALHGFIYIYSQEFSLPQVRCSSTITYRITRLSNIIHHQHRKKPANTQTSTLNILHHPQILTRRTEISHCTPYTTCGTFGDGSAAEILHSILPWCLIPRVESGACSADI